MIKSIVEKIMIKEFSKYINGIQYKKLTIEVLGGYFSIENISLNQAYFNSLETPFNVAFSHIGKLSIEAPLTKLSSVPVSCTVQDVFVIVQLKKHATHINEVTKEELLNKYIKQTYELLIEKIKDANKEEGMLDKLGKKIVDNLKFQVKNIHVRFQEQNQLHSYSFGVSLKELTFGTTDRNWKPVFIERQKCKEEEPIFKLMSVQKFKIYWQSLSKNHQQYKFLQLPTPKARIQAMRKYVSIDQDSFLSINCKVKLTINPSSNTKLPLIQLDINLDPINIKFSKQKIVEVLDFTTSCIKHNEIMLKTLLDKATKKISHDQEKQLKPMCSRYVHYFLDRDQKKGKKEGKTQDFRSLLENEDVSIDCLYEWSMDAIKSKVQMVREKELKKEKTSWFSKTEAQLTLEERKELERLLNQLAEDSIGGQNRPQQCILLHLMLNLKGLSFYFYDQNQNNKLKTIELTIDQINCNLQKSHNNSYFSLNSKIKQILADLQIEEDKQVRRIQLMENVKESRDAELLEMIYVQSVKTVGKKTKVTHSSDVVLGKTVFTYKKEYWKMFSSFFSLPEIDQQVQNQALGKLEQFKGESSDEEEEAQVEKFYNLNLNLMSPSFILPLTPSTCWFLDLGKITMQSQSAQTQFFYPFKLRNLNMRYIDTQKQELTSSIIFSSKSFFPIIKDINIDVNMITSSQDNIVNFDIILQKIELNATRQEFINLLNVKKFVVGEEDDQLVFMEESRKEKEGVQGKAKLYAKLSKRGKYLHNWIQYCCYFSNNSVYFYPNEAELIPDSILSLRGAKLNKNIQKTNNIKHYQLQITSSSETTYLQFFDEGLLDLWDRQLSKAVHQLKNMDALMLGQTVHVKKKKHSRKQDLVNINLNLRELSWNYLDGKGQSFMKIELENINFRMVQKQEKVETIFHVGQMYIYDRVYEYQNKNYQHFLKSNNLTVSVQKIKERITKISPVILDTQLQTLDLNWKPDALLKLIQSIKQFMDIRPISKHKDKSRGQIINIINEDKNFIHRNTKYTKNGLNYSVKDRKRQYLKCNSREDQIYIKMGLNINNLKINFIHRQSHMPMFLMICQKLNTQMTLAKNQKYLQGFIDNLSLYQIFGYPQKKYNINGQYQPFCILQKKSAHNNLHTLQFKYSAYDPDVLPNRQRVDSFLQLNFSPLTVRYFQEVTMRMIDYFLIQIVMLLNNPDMITANEDVLKQLLQSNNRKSLEHMKYFIEEEFEEVVKRIFQPFFMDYQVILDRPQVILSPAKGYPHYFIAQSDRVEVTNKQVNRNKRFEKTEYQFKHMVYEEEIFVKAQNLTIASKNKNHVQNILQKAVSIEAVVNRLLFEEEIIGIKPDLIGYDRSIRVVSNVSEVNIPELSKVLYQNLVRLPNFNITFEDQQEELFIHNYKITKTLSPKPIRLEMNIKELSCTAQHSIGQSEQAKLKLFSASLQHFKLDFFRDDKLNSNVEVNIHSVQSQVYEYSQFRKEPQVKTLATIAPFQNKSQCYFLIKLANTGKIDIQGIVEESQLFLNMGVLPLIADWVQVQDSVFPQSSKIMRPIQLLMRMPKIIVNLQTNSQSHSNLKAVGELLVEVNRNKVESQNYLAEAYQSKKVSPQYIQQLREFMSIKLNLGMQLFSSFKGKDRKLMDKMGIEIKQNDYFRVRSNKLKRTMNRKLNLSNIQGNISIDDVLLIKSLGQMLDSASKYQQEYKQYLQSQLGSIVIENQSNIYQDVFKQMKILEEMMFKVESIKLYFISKENSQYLPIFKLYTQRISMNLFVNTGSAVVTGDLTVGINYFNDHIFRWEPLIEPIDLRWNVTKNDEKQQNTQLQVTNNIYVNISSQNAISLKKCLKAIDYKLTQQERGEYQPQIAQQFVSRYIIKNETGHALQIFDQNDVSIYVIMSGDRINYNSKAIMRSFFEENQLEETISFNILHPKEEFMPVRGISLQNLKSFDIELYTAKGNKLPENYFLHLQNSLQGCKKIITIRSKKYITDYTSGVAVQQYYPFDHSDDVMLQHFHKGVKANFFKKKQGQKYLYYGVNGHLTIRKKFLVYNYTMIPLSISEYVCPPGTFVGINGKLTIQGIPHQDSALKVVFNQKKMEYYIYSISYIIDYVGLNISFDHDQIRQQYSHHFRQKNRHFWIYLLPSINQKFRVRLGKQSSKHELKGTLSRQNFQIVDKDSTYQFSCFSSLQTFCQQNIKDFRKVIEITSAYIMSNDTEHVISYNQMGSKEKPVQLGPNQNKPFFWTNRNLKKNIQISILTEKQQWKCSGPLSIGQATQTFIVRNTKNENQFKILSIELEQTNNMTFVHITNASNKIQILNSIPHSTISLFQAAIFENKNVNLKNPQNYIFNLPFKVRKAFGYELPTHDHNITVNIELDQQYYKWRCPSFTISDFEDNLIEKTMEIKTRDSTKKLSIALKFNQNTKTIQFSLKKQQIFTQIMETQIKCHLKNINLCLIGTHEQLRKQLINVNINNIALNFYLNEKYLEYSISAHTIRVQNTLKNEPYFVSLFRQAQKSNKPALLFAVKKSRSNPRLIYYIGFSMRKAVVTVTSEQLQILEENINNIMENLNQKSDTNALINLEQKFTPRKVVSDQKFYFAEAEIHPIRLIMTYKHVNNWGGTLLKALSINECKVKVDGKKISNFVCDDMIDFAAKIGAHFKEGFSSQIFSMIGSLALLGSPLNLASKIGGGLKNFINLPADGFEDEGVLGVGKGLAMGTGSLVSNTIEGAFGTVESITGTIGNGISGFAAYDKDFEKRRQDIKNQRVDHIGEGVLSGGKSLANGLFSGITGLVTEPIKGAQKDGVGGFLLGGLKGITGLVVKPVSGVIDATSKTAEGIKNTTKVFSEQAKEQRKRQYHPRPFYGFSREIRNYNLHLADWNQYISNVEDRYQNLSWAGMYELRDKQLLIVTYQYILVLTREKYKISEEIASSDILSVGQEGDKIVLVTRGEGNKRPKMSLDLTKKQDCFKELKRIYQHYQKNYDVGMYKTPK